MTSSNSTESVVVHQDKAFESLVTQANLRKAWQDVKKDLRYSMVRDVIDWLDWSVNGASNISSIRRDLLSGEYTPDVPTNYEVAKSKGSYRVISLLNLKDSLVYRFISDEILNRARPSQVKGAFFSRRGSVTPVGPEYEPDDKDYETFWEVWIRYHQYRTKTLLNTPHNILVISDITNYFDSIEHDLLLEYMSPFGLPRKAVALLGRLLEAFRPRSGHSPNPRVGLATDELDCSRQLAHVFLFEHDQRTIEAFGEDNYVRWMDDHTIGTEDMTSGRRVVNQLTRSLGTQRLTLNSGKTVFLTPTEVVDYFHFDLNQKLDDWVDASITKGGRFKPSAFANISGQLVVDAVLNYANKNYGYWDKILKRAYRLAAMVDSPNLEPDSLSHLVEFPSLDRRIFEYYAVRNQGDELCDLWEQYATTGENIYEGTESAFFEACLLLDPSTKTKQRIVDLAKSVASAKYAHATGRPLGRAAAVLCLYWFADNPYEIANLYLTSASKQPKEVVRSWMSTVVARLPDKLPAIENSIIGHQADDVAGLAGFLSGVLNGTVEDFGTYRRQRLRPFGGDDYYDPRMWLQFELMCQGKGKLKSRAKSDLPLFAKRALIGPEKAALARAQVALSSP